MSEDLNRMSRSKLPPALKKLADHLSWLDQDVDSNLATESDMLSLIVSGALKGENVAERYPSFYKKLLENPELRQAFLDALESIEAEHAGEQVPIPGTAQTKLDFLIDISDSPEVQVFSEQNWRVIWQRTIEQIQSIFSPSELAYRADPSMSEDPWFTLLRDEMTVEGVTYDVILDCTLSSENENSLTSFLSLAITFGNETGTTGLPLRASLNWGEYQESILVSDEGRFKFPDIPVGTVFDDAEFQLQAGFNLVLETTS